MIPREFLVEEFENVERALGETLRYDYDSEQNRKKYYDECHARLAEIKKAIAGVSTTDYSKIHAHLIELSNLSTLISLIERSHLGEFSWPFAEELRRIAETLLVEKNLKGEKLKPIVHVIADGQGYRSRYILD